MRRSELDLERRAVVTGIGLITPVGAGQSNVYEELLRGRSGIGPVTSFDTRDYPVHQGGEIRGFHAENYVRRLDPKRIGRTSLLAVAEWLEETGMLSP